MILFKKLIEKLYLKQRNNLAYYDNLTKTYNRNWLETFAYNNLQEEDFDIIVIKLDYILNDFRRVKKFTNELEMAFSEKGEYICYPNEFEFIIFSPKGEEKMGIFEAKRQYSFKYGIAHKAEYHSLSNRLSYARAFVR